MAITKTSQHCRNAKWFEFFASTKTSQHCRNAKWFEFVASMKKVII